jgi:membrane protein required for colicin V production
MQAYDVLMLIVVGLAALFGYWKGLAWQVASLASIFASYFVAYRFRDEVAQYIDTRPPWNIFLAMLILFLATSLVIWILFRLVRGFLDRAKLKEFDQHLGAILGAGKGVVLCIVITLFAVSLASDSLREAIIFSRSGTCIAKLLEKSEAIMPPELHDVLRPYLDRLDARFQPDADTSRTGVEEAWRMGQADGSPRDPFAEPLHDADVRWRR